MSLAQVQQDFLTSVNSDHDGLAQHIAAPLTDLADDRVSLTPIDRINIYRNNTRQARVRALSDIYPITEQVLGARFFSMLCHRYSQDHPASHWDLNQYGQELPQFITEQAADFDSLAELPYLEQLGQLEWLLHQAYYAADSSGFPLEQFSNLDVDRQQACRLVLAPSVALIPSDWPIYELWQCWQAGKLPETLAPLTKTEYLCVSRKHYRPEVTTITPAMFLLLSKLADNSLAALAVMPELASALEALPECIEKGWITDFYLPDCSDV